MKPYLLLSVLITSSIAATSEAAAGKGAYCDEEPISPTSRAAIEQFVRRQPKARKQRYHEDEDQLRETRIKRERRKARKKSHRRKGCES